MVVLVHKYSGSIFTKNIAMPIIMQKINHSVPAMETKITEIKFSNTFTMNTIKTIKIPQNMKVYILPEKEKDDLSQAVYDGLKEYDPVILCSTFLACRLKHVKQGFYVVLCEMCDLHVFEYYTILEEKSERIIEYSEEERRACISTDNKHILNYFRMKYDNVLVKKTGYMDNDVCIDNNADFDRVKFLISRLSRVEKIKNLEIFGVYFTHFELEDFAEQICKYLKSKGKKTYLLYLKDISYERLTCIDGIECTVLVDCDYYTHFDINIGMPVVVPFELVLAFDDVEWNGKYDVNTFDGNCGISNTSTEIIRVEYYKTGELIKRNESQCVGFDVGSYDDQIYDGYDGIAGSYHQNRQ